MTLSNDSEEKEISPPKISILSNLDDCVLLKMMHSKNLPYLCDAESVITLNCSSNYSVQEGELIFECEIETVTLVSTIDTETTIYMEDSTFSSIYFMQYEGSSTSSVDYYDVNQTNSLESDLTTEENDLTTSPVMGSTYEEPLTTQELYDEVTQNSFDEPQIFHDSNHLQNLFEYGSKIDGSIKGESYARFEYPSEDYVHDDPEGSWGDSFEGVTLEADLDNNSSNNKEDNTTTKDIFSFDVNFSTVYTDSRSSLNYSTMTPSDLYDIEHERTTPPSDTMKTNARKYVRSFELIIKTYSFIEKMKMTTEYFKKDPSEETSNTSNISWCFCSSTTKG